MAATRAVELGVDGIIVSNHGARQLDYAPATISVLEEVNFLPLHLHLSLSTGLSIVFALTFGGYIGVANHN